MTRALCAALLCLVAFAARAADDDPNAIARAVGEAFAAACAAGDVTAVLALYRDDARVVFPGAGQIAVTRAELEPLVKGMCVKGGPKLTLVGYRAVWGDTAHTVVAALGDWRMDATGPDGKTVSTPIRATEVLVKTAAGWKYAVDHASVGVAPPPAR